MDFPQSVSGVVRFGVFEANLRAGELRRSGIKVRIQEMPFRALIVLLKRPGEVIGREELRLALWPEGVFVDFDQGISSAIRRLRDALGDSADNPVFIETVERRGYRWIAPMRLAEAVPQGNGGRKEEARTEAPLPPRSSPWRKVVGNTQEALKYLEACYDRHADETVNVASDPAFNNLHPVPAFQQFLAKVGLPPVK